MTESPFSRTPAIDQAPRYDGLSIALHWASAGLILLNWLLGEFRFLAAQGSPRTAVLSTHILIGLAIAAMLPARLAWRAGPGRRLRAEPGLMGWTVKAAHAGLYLLIAVAVLAGMSHVAAHGLHLFGTVLTPGLDLAQHGLLQKFGRLHGTLADLLVLLAATHALAALAHHIVLGDEVLLRMAPFLPGRARRAEG